MYAASGLWAVEYSEIRLNKVIFRADKFMIYILGLTSSQTGNQDRRTISVCSCPKAPLQRNNRRCYPNIRQRVLFLYSFQEHMCIDASILKIQPNSNIHHRNWITKLILYTRKWSDLRVAWTGGNRTKTYHNLWTWINESVARWITYTESHSRLSHQLTADYFAGLKWVKYLRKMDYKIWEGRLTCWPDPKYQNSPFKVAPQPAEAVAPTPYSKARFSFIFPKTN